MTRIATDQERRAGGRTYRSELRAQQAEATRVRILEATVKVMARGMATLSIPEVAREAGVSVPTVYRHFATKRDLLAAIYPYLNERAGLQEWQAPRDLTDLRDTVRAAFARIESFDDLVRAAMVSPAAEEARRMVMPGRYELGRRLLEATSPEFASVDLDRIARILTVLITSSSLRVWRDHLASNADMAADDIDWAFRAMAAAATKEADR